MDPFDLFLQNATSTVPTEEQSQPARSRSPNPFLMDDSGDDVSSSQLHSSNPFAMSSDPETKDSESASGNADFFNISSIPNPFQDFQAPTSNTSSGQNADLFNLQFDEPSQDPFGRGAGTAVPNLKKRRTSNPFIEPDDDDEPELVVSSSAASNFFSSTLSSMSSGNTFDPFQTIHPSDSLADEFAAQFKNITDLLTPPDEIDAVPTPFTAAVPAPKATSTAPPLPPPPHIPPISSTKPAETKPQTVMPPPRPPPPSKTTQPPARPPPPSVKIGEPKVDDSWANAFNNNDTFSSSNNTEASKNQDLLDDFFGSQSEPVNTHAELNSFNILLEEDKVEIEPIKVHINITEATPTPKKNDINLFFDEECGSMIINKDGELNSGTLETALPRPPSIEFDAESDSPNVEMVESVEIKVNKPETDLFMDDFDFGSIATTEDDKRKEAVILETGIIEKNTGIVSGKGWIDTSAFEELEEKFSTMLSGQSQLEPETVSNYDPFSDLSVGADGEDNSLTTQGFGPSDDFDQFFGSKEIPAAPKPSPAHFDLCNKLEPTPVPLTSSSVAAVGADSPDSDDSGPDFSVFIRPKMRDVSQSHNETQSMPVPILAPPPAKSPQPRSPTASRFNPFDKSGQISNKIDLNEEIDEFLAIFDTPAIVQTKEPVSTEVKTPDNLPSTLTRASDSKEEVESLGSPVFEADDTEPLEDYYPKYDGHGWDMMLRQPSKKKLTGQRYWKKIYLTLSDNGVLHLFGKREDKDPFQELPLQACYSLSEIATQQYDQYGKIFTVKLQYVFYRERVGVRPGQINKVTQGQITSLGQLAKLGLPLEHAPQVSQLLKLGSLNYEELKEFVRVVEDALFHLTVHRDRALIYKTEEIQVTVVDELRAEVANNGVVLQQVARVRVFFLAFILNMPDVEIGLNDITKQGTEVVGRHDIIPVVTEEWIRLEKCEFHSCVMTDAFEQNRTLKLRPPDACFFELLRFRVRPPRNRELPLQVRTKMTIIGNRVEIRADVIVPGCISRKHGQIPCEDVAIRFPLPECWIYLFRTEKHFRYGSVKSTARRPGKIKGLDRFMGTGSTVEPSLIEVSTGQAKYEHQHRAIVWRVPKLPKEGQGAYSTYLFVCRMELSSYDQIPEEFDSTVYVEFYMPTTTVSHTTIRSISVTNQNPPEKYVKYLARHAYRVGIEHVNVTTECEYVTATGGNAGTGGSKTSGACSREPSEENDSSVPHS